RNRLGAVVYDSGRDALSAQPASARLLLPKAYLAWESELYAAVIGSYRIGFGQRLTFDTSFQLDPNGISADDELFRGSELVRACRENSGELDTSPCSRASSAGHRYVTPDYRWRNGLLGVAAGAKRIRIGSGVLQIYGFFSLQPRAVYQYEIYDRHKCSD